jgi:hypothetical protein
MQHLVWKNNIDDFAKHAIFDVAVLKCIGGKVLIIAIPQARSFDSLPDLITEIMLEAYLSFDSLVTSNAQSFGKGCARENADPGCSALSQKPVHCAI